MKRRGIIVSIMVLVIAFSLALVGCVAEPKDEKNIAVKFMDGTTVLKTVMVESGEKVEKYTPTKAEHNFVDWFASPAKSHAFNFDEPILKDVAIFAGFSKFQADTRDFKLVGAGTSNLLFESSWGKVITDKHKLTKHATKNEYSITFDVLKGDVFQFALNTEWHNKRGFGYMSTAALADGTEAFSKSGGGIGEVGAKGAEIKVEKEGNYTFTLTTYPLDDTYDTGHASYTEATKEVHNLGTYDKITWVRNGEVVEVPNVTTNFHVKGAGITGWSNTYNGRVTLVQDPTIKNKYSLSVFLKKDDEFMIISTFTRGGVASDGNVFVRGNNLDDASKALFEVTASANMKPKADGTYTLTYDTTTEKLSATVDAAKLLAVRDYYIDGNFAGEWGDTLYGKEADRKVVGEKADRNWLFIADYKLKETAANSGIYEIQNIELAAGTQIIIQSYKAGATEPGKWGTDGYNALGTFTFPYLNANAAFKQVSGGGTNIEVVTAGTYNITINAYSGLVTIADGFDIYIKGSNNGWDHKFAAANKFALVTGSKTSYEMEITFAANAEFGFALYSKGATAGAGAFINKTAAGTAADNADFIPATGNNFKASKAGKYKIVYDSITGKIDFTKAV